MDAAMQRVIDAWNNPGPHPEHHRAMQAKLRTEWPVLAAALDSLVRSGPPSRR